jgi:hypothetical protein
MDKDRLLKESKVFCMAPWIHAHTSPIGDFSACCIAKEKLGSSLENSLEQLVNSDGMRNLRTNMISEKESPSCTTCYQHEKQGQNSFRNKFNKDFGRHLEESLIHTNMFGYLSNFKMRYFDLRFTNICNFKCRTCNSAFSSQWEFENLKRKLPDARVFDKNNKPEFLKEILDQVPHMETAYFAGGEPLITEEHYILLEEMIRLGKTDIQLSYNSNASNLKFKQKDVLDLWSRFNKPILMAASIDHYGERAEYIRNGTDWAQVESNLLKFRSLDNMSLTLNTVVSIFNYTTLHDFYNYIIDKNIISPTDHVHTTYSMVSPEHLTARALPKELKAIGKQGIQSLIVSMRAKGFLSHQTNAIGKNIVWAETEHTWDTYKTMFQEEVVALDKVRGESFTSVFPELTSLLD